MQIGTEITGNSLDVAFVENFNFAKIQPLSNGNYVIGAILHDNSGFMDNGFVQLVNGVDGDAIGPPVLGLADSDNYATLTALETGNYVLTASNDNSGNITDAGSVRLMDGTTGLQIATEVTGILMLDHMGSNGVIGLPNGNYVISSQFYDVPGVINAGFAQLMDGSSGMPVGASFSGTDFNDSIGNGGAFSLANGNFVVGSETFGGTIATLNVGLWRIIDATSGDQVGADIMGDDSGDNLGRITYRRLNGGIQPRTSITPLPNNNYVIASENDDVSGSESDEAGGVRLINGNNNMQIGNTFHGDVAGDNLGNGDVVALANSNYVVLSSLDDEGGQTDVGSARLFSGTTGLPIGDPVVGLVADDMQAANAFGSAKGDVHVLNLPLADSNGMVDAGRVLISQ